MKRVFAIVFENELEFTNGAGIIGDRFINSDNTIEYCGSWGEIWFNTEECLKAISSTVNHFIRESGFEEIYFGCCRKDFPEIKEMLLCKECEINVIPYADFIS